MSRRLVLPAALVVALALAADAHAWAPIDSSRPVWSLPVPYGMHNAGSADLGVAMTETLVRQGMDDWTRVSCTSLRTNYTGQTSSRPSLSGGGDGMSLIGWIESGWPHESGAIGVTGPRWFRTIAEADMQMNGQHYTWITGSGSGSRVNAYSIILHEGGHYYGLGHSSSSSATMYYAYSGGIATLTSDDQNGICALYPGSGTDCTTTGCPAGQTCEGGTCVAMMGDGNVCSPCTSGADCMGGSCLRYPDGQGYCSRSCSSAADCGGDQCIALTGIGQQCIRFSGGTPSCAGGPTGCTSDSQCGATERCNTSTGDCEPRPSTGGPIGAPCGSAAECQSGLCFAGTCSQSCDWLSPTSCPGGYYCSGAATGSCSGGGVCVAGSAGGGAIGAACGAATDCASLYCASGVCSTPCIPGGAAGCATGYACQVGAVPGCGSCQRSGQLGDPCMVNEECTSRICAELIEGEGFCTSLCDGTSCPSGFRCEGAGGGVAVCVPDAGTLGDDCADNEDCLSGICAEEDDTSYCTRLCDDSATCPLGFDCVETGAPGINVCRPEPSQGCGCSTPGTTHRSAAPLALCAMLGLALALRRRR